MHRRIRHAVLFFLCTALVTGCSGTSSAPPPPPPPSSSASPSSTSKPLKETLAELARNDPAFTKLRAVLVMRDGRVVFEQYYSSLAGDYRSVFSVTKSVVSALVGIAVADGDLALDDTLGELLPKYRSDMDQATAQITLKQLLTMRGGFDDTWSGSVADFPSENWVRTALKHHGAVTGTGEFAYSDYGAHLIAAILTEATGQHLLDYARERLFDPIGIISRPGIEPLSVPENSGQYERAGFAWPVDPQGINLGDSLLRITPRDLLTFGRLYLDGGRAGGKQVVPADWVRDSTSQQVPPTSHRDGYGYLWWTGTDDDDPAFRAVGYGGQLIEVVPSRKLVLVIAADVSLTDPNDPGISGSGARVLADTFILPEFT